MSGLFTWDGVLQQLISTLVWISYTGGVSHMKLKWLCSGYVLLYVRLVDLHIIVLNMGNMELWVVFAYGFLLHGLLSELQSRQINVFKENVD